MQIPIHSVAELGLLVRAVRKQQGLRADDLAGAAALGPVFVLDLENGKATVQAGKVLQLLAELGLSLSLDVPPEALAQLEAIGSKARGTQERAAFAQALERVRGLIAAPSSGEGHGR